MTPALRPPFVDRVVELEKLQRYALEGYYPVLFIYGPEGCGKTRLLRELVSRLQGREDLVAVYVDAGAGQRLEDSLLAPRSSSSKPRGSSPGRALEAPWGHWWPSFSPSSSRRLEQGC